MTEIRPLREDYLLPRCLHAGPMDTLAEPSAVPGPDLPPHPWSDDTICALAANGSGWPLCQAGSGWPAGLMRELIHRHGTCALLAWEGRSVAGFVRFYPLTLARMMAEADGGWAEPILDPRVAGEPGAEPGTLWVHCVMTSRPYTGGTAAGHTVGGHGIFRTPQEAGARRGIGLQLAHALVPWAREHGWERLLKIAHPDLDFYYGIWGGGGKRFWEQAGFEVADSFYQPQPWHQPEMATLRAQMQERGITVREAFTFYRMTCEL